MKFTGIIRKERWNLLHRSDLIVLVSILNRCQTRDFAENSPEGLGIRITHLHHHLVDILPARFKAAFCHFHFHTLDILQHRIAGSAPEPALETSSSYRHPVGKRFNAEPLLYAALDIFLGFPYRL